ncbi:MAG TPA: PaaI family thioesterase [Cryomorphaceae bacterium]|nr:PaaI family thioesterase [Cryomorphaceae bacterium]
MMNQLHFKKLENVYHSAKINRIPYRGMTLKVSEGVAELTYPVSSDFFHKMEALHGSVYFKMLDDAAYFAVNSVVAENFVVTTSFSIDLLRPVTGGTLTATGAVSFSSKNLWVAEAVLVDERGRKIAIGKGRFTKSRFTLQEVLEKGK